MEGHPRHIRTVKFEKNDGSFKILRPIYIWKLSREDKVVWSRLVAMSRIHTGGQVLHMIRRHLKKTKDSNCPEKHQLHPVQKTLSNIALVIFSFIDLPAIKLYCHQTLDVVDISSCGRFGFAQEQIDDVIF